MRVHAMGSLIALVVLGCHDSPVALSSSAGVVLTMSLSSAAIVAGQPDTITMTLRNAGAVPDTLNFGDACWVVPYIRDGRGAVVVPDGGGWGCADEFTQVILGGGERITRSFIWAGGHQEAGVPSDSRLQAGDYFVTAQSPAYPPKLVTGPVRVRLW